MFRRLIYIYIIVYCALKIGYQQFFGNLKITQIVLFLRIWLMDKYNFILDIYLCEQKWNDQPQQCIIYLF